MKTLCVSLETAKALKAAGWTKPTELIWAIAEQRSAITLSGLILGEGVDTLSAPSVEEFLCYLPEMLEMGGVEYRLEVIKKAGAYELAYACCDPDGGEKYFFGNKLIVSKSLSEAAAQMWIWCVENKYIEVKP